MTRPGPARAMADRGRGALAIALLVVLLASGCGTDGAVPSASSSAASSTEVPPSDVALAASPPVRVEVPAIGLDSDLMALGLQDDGALEVPPTGFPAGWFTGAPTPGEVGPAIMAGHVDWDGSPGVFYDLRSLATGDEITVTRADGSVVLFGVVSVDQFPKDEFPSEAVYGDLDHAALRLITCGGSFDRTQRSYADNIVVFADLIGPAPA